MTTLEESFRLALLGMETGETVVIGGIGEIDVGGGAPSARRVEWRRVEFKSIWAQQPGRVAIRALARVANSLCAFPTRAATRVARKGIISVCASTG